MGSGNGGVQSEMFAGVPPKARGQQSVIDEIFDEFEELSRRDDEEAIAARREVGGRFMDIAQEGMSTVGRTRFELTHRSRIGSVIDTGLDLLGKYHVIKSEGPALMRAANKLFALFK